MEYLDFIEHIRAVLTIVETWFVLLFKNSDGASKTALHLNPKHSYVMISLFFFKGEGQAIYLLSFYSKCFKYRSWKVFHIIVSNLSF